MQNTVAKAMRKKTPTTTSKSPKNCVTRIVTQTSSIQYYAVHMYYTYRGAARTECRGMSKMKIEKGRGAPVTKVSMFVFSLLDRVAATSEHLFAASFSGLVLGMLLEKEQKSHKGKKKCMCLLKR